MSLSSAISNALSGVTAASRGTELVATNIANKSVAGYARRELELSSRIHTANGGGVGIDGVRRAIDAGLLSDSRLALAASSQSGTVATFHAVMEQAFGTANDASALGAALTGLDNAILSASARPDNQVRLNAVLDAAKGIAQKINGISQTISTARSQADHDIGKDVASLNDALERVAALNRQITVTSAQGGDPSSLIDARQDAIDQISAIVPIQEVTRENGRVALFTKGGATLLDGTAPAQIGFVATGTITAGMSVENGALGTLSLNGRSLAAQEMAGGTLSAHFQIRDRIAPGFQAQIDGFARDLYSRFADPAVDPTLAAGQPGIFTDAQTALLPANEPGFADRIAVNAAIDPQAGGALWRIRAGLGAADPGEVGESSLRLAMGTALADSRPPASSELGTGPRTLIGLASEIASGAATQRLRSEAVAVQDQSRAGSLRTALLAGGVDTDTEMEALLSLERAYAANAKVLQTANDMLDQILRLT
ncbi:flagellar hook-associated protein FlgK [Paracoccus laeviglucosivorans]|uniref:Flagellar hook-associated protein 1 n=1 Tax=Paracoccus laeviglucosivorans TaxID=1197861 RepID=A0A521DT05_9RHOB|nr:flagellar hook-associated protein FlgK [Paracoccus laeviglucosivorans]SMO74839.1 flagellar hook-associated protein 1 FlgK [Paracoccus laeviglucosivorans]